MSDGRYATKAVGKIFREEKLISEVDIESIRREKSQVKEVSTGLECGICFHKFDEIKEHDRIEFYTRVNNEKNK